MKAVRLGLACILLLILAVAPVAARGSQTATLNVALRPERLGGRTTIVFNVQSSPTARLCPPL